MKLTKTCNILKIDNKNNFTGDMTNLIDFEKSVKALILIFKIKIFF